MSRFTPDAAGGLPGPDWLVTRRRAAAEQLANVAPPTSGEEIWRYSRIGALDLDRYAPLDAASAAAGAGLPAEMAFVPAGCSGRLVTVNGRLVEASLPDGVKLRTDGGLGEVMTEPADRFALLNDAFGESPLVVSVAAGRRVEGPIAVVHWLDEQAEGTATFPRLVVHAGADAAVEVLQVITSADVDTLVCPVVEVRAGRDADVRLLTVQDLGPRAWQIASLVAEADTNANVVLAAAAFGGSYARSRTDCRLAGRGASAKLVALYFGNDHQMHDFRTFQDHRAPDTTSDLLFKGAVDDESHSVYSGLIRVRPGARGTNALQTNRNIKLSEGAWAESVPNLEIENNDVRCSHASAVGPIDADQRFYLESRGVRPAVAERLIVTGFFEDVIRQMPVPGAGDAIRARVAAKLAAHTNAAAGVGA